MVGFLIPWTMPRWGSGGVRRAFNFTLMSDAQLQASGWSWTRPNAIYVPDSAGDYAEIASGVLAKSDLGVHCFGGFVNIAANGLFSGAVAGAPGTMPTNNSFLGTRTAVAVGTEHGLPLLTVTGEWPSSSVPCAIFTGESNQVPVAYGDVVHQRCLASIVANNTPGARRMWLLERLGVVGNAIEITDNSRQWRHVSRTENYGPELTIQYPFLECYQGSSTAVEFSVAGWQIVKNIGLHPNVLALSSAVSTATAAQIPILSRVTPGECSFVLPVITSPGRKGTDDVIASASADANNQLLVIHKNADNHILLRLVTAGSTVGEVDLGVVGNNVYTVISGSVKTGRLAGALEGMSEMIEVTGAGIVPPAEFTRWTLGNDHSQAAATQFWGSVLQLRIN